MKSQNIDYSLTALRKGFGIMDRDELSFCPSNWGDDGAPPVDWMVDGAFPRGSVCLVSSDGGLGKSLLMQQLCTAAALGVDWLGMRVKPCKSWALFCEDDRAELRRRQEKINRHYQCGMGDLGDVTYRSMAGHYAVMAEFPNFSGIPHVTGLFNAAMAKARQVGAQLIVLDTASDVFGGNEIQKDQVRAFITLLRRWAMEIDGCVILTSHVSNEGLSSGSGLSGSRAWNNSVRSRLWLTDGKKDETGNKRQLRGMKSNYGPRGKALDLVWSEGVFKRVDAAGPKNYSEPSIIPEDWPI